MADHISRRDFLGGAALIIAGGLTPRAQMRAEPCRYYPPALRSWIPQRFCANFKVTGASHSMCICAAIIDIRRGNASGMSDE
jgi:hypothetical protein